MSKKSKPRLDWRVILNRSAARGVRGWGRVRASQIDETCRAFTVAAGAQAINAILLTFILRDSVPLHFLGLWVAALVTIMIAAQRERNRWRRLKVKAVSRRAIEKVSWQSLLFGVVWAAPSFFFFRLAAPPEQIAICLVTASMMAGAAFIFTTLPHAAGGYVLIMGAAASNMLWSTGDWMIMAMGPIYTAGLFLMLLSNGRAFIERRYTELELEERSDTVSLLLREYESSDADWLWETRWDLSLENVSPRFARAVDRAAEEVAGRSIVDLLAPGDKIGPEAVASIERLRACLEQHGAISGLILPILTRDGVKSIELSARPRFNAQGRFIGYRGVGSDVTAAQESAQRIAHMARHDALTGLPNRVQLHEALGAALDSARDGKGKCAMLLIDLDRFKTVNDTLGHVAGDHLLQQVAGRILPVAPRDAMIGRFGGDEFAMVVPHVVDTGGLEAMCRRIIEVVKHPFVYNDQHLFVGASIGVCLGPDHGKNVEELIRNADLALYRAKADGGNEICFYDPSLHAVAEERRQIELAMRGALEAGQFRVVYQPLVEAKSERIGSFEALVRWTHPELGEIPPMKFIPLAEETGLVRRIGEWVLRTACAEAARWGDGVGVAVNLSPLQLQDQGFIATLVSALSQSGLEPERLELEITETMFLQMTPAIRTALRQIRALGVKLAIDDFGTGYSSLGYLKDNRFDTIKIDRTFVHGIAPDDPESLAIIKAVVALAGSLGMRTVAEGVETNDQYRILTDLGCDKIQGFLLSRPRPPEEARAMLASKTRLAA